MVFMRREYTLLAAFALVLFILLLLETEHLGIQTAVAFVAGALASAGAGWIGMYTATKANVRTTTAAEEKGAAAALSVAFFGGSIMGLAVASLGLCGLGLIYYLFGGDPETAHHIHGFGMGASTVALFSRVGGGIYTKSADVGADLVGKTEENIPEDDPRNPGVIADNVGDNVGDVAGMGSDIFESYCGSMIASIAIASTLSAAGIAELFADGANADRGVLMFLPAFARVGRACVLDSGNHAGENSVEPQSCACIASWHDSDTDTIHRNRVFPRFKCGATEPRYLVLCTCWRGWRDHHWIDNGVLHFRTPDTNYCRTRKDGSCYGLDYGSGNRYAIGSDSDIEHLRDYLRFHVTCRSLRCSDCGPLDY